MKLRLSQPRLAGAGLGMSLAIVEIKKQELEGDGFNDDELDFILHHVCVS